MTKQNFGVLLLGLMLSSTLGQTSQNVQDESIALSSSWKLWPIHCRAQFALEFLRAWLASAGKIVTETKVLSNYPNPFNPETWIPYQLSAEAKVEISIYSVDGPRVRTLQFGTRPRGIYITKEKAAYWDGQNHTGEAVSSGTYFYHFQAGDYDTTKKMVILK